MEQIEISKVRHHGEQWSLAVLLIFTALLLTLAIVSVVGIIWLALFIFLEMLFHRLTMAFFRANSVQLNEEQYPKLYQLAQIYSEKLGLKRVPDIYIIQQTTLNAFATRVARRYVIVLYSHTVETMMEEERTDALGMVLAHELGHIAAKHLLWGSIISGVGLFIPLLHLYWSRSCEYTADRLAYLCLEDKSGALEGLLKLTVGKKLAPVTNLEALAKQRASLRKDRWAKIVEMWSTHPHLLNRIDNLQEFSKEQATNSKATAPEEVLQ